MTDIIGDIHGYADHLKALLIQLGYTPQGSGFRHPERKVLFVGDYIDRGPQIPEVLKIVRSMVEDGEAIALMGNHEYNAICFHRQKNRGGYLRKHSIKNIVQHYETLRQFNNRQHEYDDYIQWFLSLPLFYESDSFRAVHACWSAENISYLRSGLENDCLTDELVEASVEKGTQLYRAVEETLKGREMPLPSGMHFHDKDGARRTEIRIKWWENPRSRTYRELSVLPLENLPNEMVQISPSTTTRYYSPSEKPVFFGHYWLKGNPALYRGNICCLDYSVAKGGYLTVYRFSGERALNERNFSYV